MKNLKNVIFSLALLSLTACSSTTTGSAPETTAPPAAQTGAPAEPTTTGAAPTEPNAAEISFQKAPKDQTIGFLDTVNENPAKNPVTATRNSPIKVAGWAVLPNGGTPAEMVIITTADNKVVATAPVALDRPDVAKVLKKDDLKKSGWTATIDPTKITTDKVSLTAWVYDPNTKQAFPLQNVAELSIQ